MSVTCNGEDRERKIVCSRSLKRVPLPGDAFRPEFDVRGIPRKKLKASWVPSSHGDPAQKCEHTAAHKPPCSCGRQTQPEKSSSAGRSTGTGR